MNLNGFKLKIMSEYLPLSIKYEYLRRFYEILETDKYSFFTVEKRLEELQESFNRKVCEFNCYLNLIYNYLKENNNFYNLDANGEMYRWLIENVGILMFMYGDIRAHDIVSELILEKNKSFPVFKIDDKYLFRLKQIYEYLCNYGNLPVQTDRTIKFEDGAYMGSFLSHNKKRIYMLKEANEHAYSITKYYEMLYLNFNDKLNEVYEYLLQNGDLPYIDDKQVKFSNGEVMSYFISHNRRNLEMMNDNRAKIIIYYLNKRKGLSFDEKILEVYNMLLDEDFVLSKNSTFSDGVNIKKWFRDNKRKLIKLKDDDRISFILKKCFKLSFEEKVLEAHEYLDLYHKIPSKDDKDIIFSDGVLMGMWFSNNKREIYLDEDLGLKEKMEDIKPHCFDRIEKVKVLRKK